MRLNILMPLLALAPVVASAQSAPYYQSDFPPEEFRARWKKVYEKIEDGLAIVQGAPKVRGFDLPRQTNEFYYLCGIDTPHAYILLDGSAKRTNPSSGPRAGSCPPPTPNSSSAWWARTRFGARAT